MNKEELNLERQKLRVEAKFRLAEIKLQREQFEAGRSGHTGWRVILTPTGAAITAAIVGIFGSAASKWFDLTIERQKQEVMVILKASEVPQGLDESSRTIQRARNLIWFAEAGYITLPQRYLEKLRSDGRLNIDEDPSAPAVQSNSPPSRFQAMKQAVYNRGSPPDTFLSELIAWGKTAPDDIFTEDASKKPGDIYASVEKQLGPWRSTDHRRAVMLEVMRVLAGFESDWNWKEGPDLTNPTSSDPNSADAGAWQVSADSMNLNPELKRFVMAKIGNVDPKAFQKAIKEDHPFAMEYAARLLRHRTDYFGSLFQSQLVLWIRRDAVKEFEILIGGEN